jgi:DNA-binding transcriptional ArsR family regulator
MVVSVERERFRRAILAAVADEEIVRILDCATLRPKSVNDAIKETDVSHSTAYRKIKWMLEEGLLFTDKIDITPDGKKFSLFRSTLKLINIKYEHGKMTVQVEYNLDVVEKITERLFSLAPD